MGRVALNADRPPLHRVAGRALGKGDLLSSYIQLVAVIGGKFPGRRTLHAGEDAVPVSVAGHIVEYQCLDFTGAV